MSKNKKSKKIVGEKSKDCVIYARTATLDDKKNGIEIAEQAKKCIQFAIAEGYTPVGVFRDPSTSGAMLRRPGLDSLLEFCSNGYNNVSTVVVTGLDRLARTFDLCDVIMDHLKYLGVNVLEVYEGKESSIVIKSAEDKEQKNERDIFNSSIYEG
jgi:DNA invertase Pin-like site-specific DNA recombinase